MIVIDDMNWLDVFGHTVALSSVQSPQTPAYASTQ